MHQILAGLIVILVNGAPQPQYTHNGRLYVEALKGKEYAIRIRNPYPVRAAVALSVDGLNTIDASHTSAADARKWVLGPHETLPTHHPPGHSPTSTRQREWDSARITG